MTQGRTHKRDALGRSHACGSTVVAVHGTSHVCQTEGVPLKASAAAQRPALVRCLRPTAVHQVANPGWRHGFGPVRKDRSRGKASLTGQRYYSYSIDMNHGNTTIDVTHGYRLFNRKALTAARSRSFTPRPEGCGFLEQL